MVRKRILQLIAAGIISLLLSFDDYVYPCDDLLSFRGYAYYEFTDPDRRYAIPVFRSIHPNPTDMVVVETARCLRYMMERELIEEIEFNGQYMNEMDVQEMLNW